MTSRGMQAQNTSPVKSYLDAYVIVTTVSISINQFQNPPIWISDTNLPCFQPISYSSHTSDFLRNSSFMSRLLPPPLNNTQRNYQVKYFTAHLTQHPSCSWYLLPHHPYSFCSRHATPNSHRNERLHITSLRRNPINHRTNEIRWKTMTTRTWTGYPFLINFLLNLYCHLHITQKSLLALVSDSSKYGVMIVSFISSYYPRHNSEVLTVPSFSDVQRSMQCVCHSANPIAAR